jgi:hypothetical protein
VGSIPTSSAPAPVAQLEEQERSKLKVGGSTPSRGTKRKLKVKRQKAKI